MGTIQIGSSLRLTIGAALKCLAKPRDESSGSKPSRKPRLAKEADGEALATEIEREGERPRSKRGGHRDDRPVGDELDDPEEPGTAPRDGETTDLADPGDAPTANDREDESAEPGDGRSPRR